MAGRDEENRTVTVGVGGDVMTATGDHAVRTRIDRATRGGEKHPKLHDSQ